MSSWLILFAVQILKDEPTEESVRYLAYEKLCTCDRELGSVIEAKTYCDKALEHQQDPRMLCERAELHIANDDFDEGESPTLIEKMLIYFLRT